jgi:hypothetical protein
METIAWFWDEFLRAMLLFAVTGGALLFFSDFPLCSDPHDRKIKRKREMGNSFFIKDKILLERLGQPLYPLRKMQIVSHGVSIETLQTMFY